MNEIETKLDALADCYSQRDLIALDKQALIDTILTDEIKAKIADIEAEFKDKGAAVAENIATLEGEIKTLTLAEGATVKGSTMMAVWNKGRTSWDSKRLEGLAIAIPAVLEARTVGDPSVTIRRR